MSTGLKNGHHATYGILFYVNSVCVLNSRLHCMSQCQNSSKFLSASYLMKTADVIMIFFLHTILLIILNKAS